MGCGYTLMWRDLDALLWRTVLLGTPSRDEVPPSALGRLWVVTSVHGQPWSNPVMPTFTLLSGGTITGQDGCGVYHVDENGNSEPSTPCDAVPEPVQVRRPFEFSSPEPPRLTSEQVAAELFDLGEPTVVTGALQFVGEYTYGGQATVSLRAGSVVVVTACGSRLFGIYSVVDGRMRFDLDRSACDDGGAGFAAWLRQMVTTGGRVRIHDGDARGLWIDVGGHVTRLAPM
jgi:hypothetical protein